MKTFYFVFVGQNATTGQAHPVTGLYSNYGHIIAFKEKAGRDQFIEEFRPDGFTVAMPCNKQSARQYHLGQSMYIYNQILDEAISEAR